MLIFSKMEIRSQPSIGSKVADLGKAADITNLQHNCHRQYNDDFSPPPPRPGAGGGGERAGGRAPGMAGEGVDG